ncbi:MAG: hypothetical protein CMO74_14395 [Verrucomicrobiales bacterium]|nr:hypothetical protein [Verrucomicrobiales bacterium]|tara:strand:+ start:76626 stop:77069 length:444 start_codon:yes stop_codon:yes gene_type:complete
MSLQNVQAQLGNLLAAMPLKVQKVDSSFLDNATPPFEGALASDAQGQFYISDHDGSGELVWKALAGQKREVSIKYDVPLNFESATIPFGTTFDTPPSVFVQYEPPDGDDVLFYSTVVKNITNTGFDLFLSDTVKEEGGIVHVLVKAL